jgi:nucleoid DNA-binding protein
MERDMDIEELARAVSKESSVERSTTLRVLEATFAIIGAELAKEQKVGIPGFGTIVRKLSRKSGKEGKILFTIGSAAGETGSAHDTKARRGKKLKKKYAES